MKPTLTALSLFLVAMLNVSTAQAASPCQAKEWRFARNQTDHQYAYLFSKMKRNVLIQNYFYELTTLKDLPLAKKMSLYLSSTEQDPEMQTFFENLNWASDLSDQDGGHAAIELKKICELYKTTLNHK